MDKLDEAIKELTTIIRGKSRTIITSHGAEDMLEWLKELKAYKTHEEESFEWCKDCKEYDQDAHCCHRWTKVIRQTVADMSIVNCIGCMHLDNDGGAQLICGITHQPVTDFHYCGYGEKPEER